MPPPALQGGGRGAAGPGLAGQQGSVTDFAKREAGKEGGDVGKSRGDEQKKIVDEELRKIPADQRNGAYANALAKAKEQNTQLDAAGANFKNRNLAANQQGKLGVDLSLSSNELRSQERLQQTASRVAYGRNCVDVGGIWIDDQFQAKTVTFAVKAQSEAYFRILEMQPKMRDVFRLGNYLVWMTPNGTALVVDQNDGKEKLTDAEIEGLFVVKK